MKSYGQFCSIAKAAELFCERWTAIVIRNIAAGSHRFSDIRRGAPHMSATLLSQRLKQLEAEGIVLRQKTANGKSWTYHLSEAGQEFVPMIGMLGQWGRRWTRRELGDGELDLGLLIWGLEHCVKPEVLGADKATVHLHFTDVPANKADYWFVNDAGETELCVSDPGNDIALFLAATLENMTHIYRGDIAIERAIADDLIEVIGAMKYQKLLKEWLNLGPLAEIPLAKGAPVTTS